MSTATLPQNMVALRAANEIRLEMTARRRRLQAMTQREGQLLAAEWLDEPDEIVARMRVEYLLMSIRRFGRVKSRRICTEAGNQGMLSRRIGGRISYGDALPLTATQRRCLAAGLRRAVPS